MAASENKLRYMVLDSNNEFVIAFIYEHPVYGRSTVIYTNQNADFSGFLLYEIIPGEQPVLVKSASLVEFFHSMIK